MGGLKVALWSKIYPEAPPQKLLILDFKTVTSFSIWWSVFLDNWYIISRNIYVSQKKIPVWYLNVFSFSKLSLFFWPSRSWDNSGYWHQGYFNFSHSEEKVERASHTFISTSTWQNLKVRTVLKSSEFQNVLTFWIWWRFDGVINEIKKIKNLRNEDDPWLVQTPILYLSFYLSLLFDLMEILMK